MVIQTLSPLARFSAEMLYSSSIIGIILINMPNKNFRDIKPIFKSPNSFICLKIHQLCLKFDLF